MIRSHRSKPLIRLRQFIKCPLRFQFAILLPPVISMGEF